MKKLQTKLAYSILAAWTFTFIISLFPSCEIGLGGAVDTQPPSLTITNPKVDSVIRDQFLIAGTWTDDGNIASVKATLIRTDGKGKPVEIDGSFTQDERQGGNWKVLVDYKAKKLIDGTYQASIAIKDKSGRVTTQNTTFTIDNTAPVLVLSRPSIKDGQSGFDSYGRSFTLEGKAADDNDISHIEVNIYENADSTEPMKTIGLDNIPLTIEQDVAVYDAAEANDYAEIYGHTDENGIIQEIGDTEQRYCTITIYDGAERFPVDGSAQTEADKKGNSSNVYYMNSEITTLLQGKYKITDLYHIMNGNYGTDAGRAAAAENVIALLEPYKVSKSKFSINPANNPRFLVSSLNVKESDKTLENVDYQFTAGNRYIEVEIRPGLDGYPINPDTVGVYLLECDENGVVQDPDNKIWLIKTGAEYHKTQDEAEAAGQTLENEAGIYSVTGSTYKFKTSKLINKSNYDVKIGAFYLVKVDGHDSQNEESGKIIENGTYGFKLVSNEEKIELSAEGVPEYLPIDENVWKDNDNPITFSATLSWEKGEVPFDVYRANETKQFVKIATVNSAAVNNKWQFVDEFDYDSLIGIAAAGETFPKQLNYILKNSVGDELSTTARITLKYDSEKPKISNIQISNSYEKKIKDVNNQDKYIYYVRNEVGNLCEISGTATDKNGIKTIILKIPGLDDEEHEGGDGHFTFEDIDFHTLSGSVTASIIAYDNAGNSVEYPIEFIFDTTGPVATHEIDDKIKDLYFRIGSSNNDDISKDTSETKYGIKWNNDDDNNKIDEDVGSKYSNGAYGNDSTIQIRGKFTDAGSGVKRIYYQVRSTETPYTDENALKNLAKEIKDDTEKTKSFSLLETPETKRVFYNSTETTNGYDGTVGGRIEEPVTQLIQIDVNPDKPTKKFYKNVETNYKNSLTGFNEGNNYLILVAEDNVGNLSVDVARNVPYKDNNGDDQIGTFVNYTLNVDTVVPDISTNSTDIRFTNQQGIVELSGTVNDIGAGLRSLDFYLNNDKLAVYSGEDDDKPPLIQGTQDIDYSNLTKCIVSITTTSGKSKGPNGEDRYNDWNIIIPASLFTDAGKTYSVYAVAKDNAGTGNEKKESVGTVKVDGTGPTVTVTSPTSGSSVNKTIVISGNVSDGNGAGIDKTSEKAPKLYWTTSATAKVSNPDPEDLADTAYEGWVEIALSTEQKPTALTAKTWNTDKSEWSYTIDTEKLKEDGASVVSNGTTAYFTVCATDKSGTGNAGYATPHTLIVDQNSDRPVIKFSNLDITKPDLTDNKIWITKEDLYASVSDDDGEVTKFRISFDGTNWEEEDNQGNKYYTSENGLSYTIPTNKDGAQTIYFEVTDAKGKVFVSTEEVNTVNAPKLAYKTTEISETVLYSKIDLKEPAIPCIYYSGEDFSTVTTAAALDLLFNSNNKNLPADLTKWHDLTNIAEALGGSTKQIYILVKAKDENGIKSVSSIFAGNPVEAIISSKDTTENTMAALFMIDISSIGTTIVEKKRIDIKAIDNANHNHTNSIDIEIDNVAPVVDIDSPSANAELYGTAGVAQNNVTVRGRTSDSSEVTKVYLAVTKGENVEPAASGISAYKDITKRSALSWTVVFNGSQTSSDDVYYTDLFNTYIDSLYGENTTTSVTQEDLCLWLYAEDKLGNSGKENPVKLPLTILTQGDKPIISITYPTTESTVGGVITITGSTSIAINEVDKIFVQIDPNYDHEDPDYNISNNEFASGWDTSLQTIISAATTAGKTIEYSIEEIKNSNNDYILDSGNNRIKGIVAGGSKQSWNIILNAASEFNTDGNRDIAVRAYAISKTNKISEPVTTWFTLDPDSPTFGNNEALTIVQYENNTNGTGNVKASKLYTPGMWIQGKWWLIGSVEDDAGIDYVKLDGTSLTSVNLLEPPKDAQDNPLFKGYILKIPVGKALGTETVYGPNIKLVTKESNGEKTSTTDIKFYYDNIPPDFECITLKTDSELGEGETNTLVQSDGVCEIKGTLKELGEQSGFKRIVFYVTRTSNGNDYITDVMKKQGTGLENCILLSGLTSDDDLYWKTVTGCTAKNSIEIEVPAASLPSFARSGGLCRINEVIYRIESITDGESNKKIVTIDSKIDNGSVSVDFALAQVIDNKVSELGITTFFGDDTHEITNDDDDEMVESYKESSGEWTVSINSKNIYDGVIQIHFVAFDEAGNKTTQLYTASVANNAPRIAGVVFGTDTNGNGTFEEESEKRFGYNGIYTVGPKTQKQNITVNGQAANGTKISKLALPNDGTDITVIDNTKNSLMTVKGDMIVIPEIVGGNKGLSWTYSVDGVNKSTSATVLNNTHSADDSVRTDNTTIVLDTLTLLKNTTEDKATVFGFKIWDHTEGTTPGTNSNYAELLLKVNIALRDNEKPTAGIKPFYWNSIPVGDNNNSSIVYENGVAFGHIELENDLPQSGFNYTGTDGEEYDLDPKVSGVVYLEGFAKDNVVVEKLYLKFPGLTGFDDFAVVAHRDRTDSSTKGQLIKNPNLSDNGVEFVSADEEVVEEGDNEYNVVHWKLKIDTSKLTTSVATNILVQIKAEDRGVATLINDDSAYNYQNAKQSDIPAEFDIDKNQTGYSLDAAGSVEMSEGRPTYDSTNQTPSYRIDVVPYIAKVYTSLGALKKNNWSVYNRTALGHYPVASDGTIYIYGFNLGKTGYLPEYGTTSLAEPAAGTEQNANYPSGPKSDTNPESEYAAYSVVTLPVTNVTSSGKISLKVNSVETLNNINNDNARGSYTGSVDLEVYPTGDKTTYSTYYYNRQPNGDNNNLLTDDVEVDIWQINSNVAQAQGSAYIAEAIMKINPISGMLNFAFNSGPANYAMANGTTTSYTTWVGNLARMTTAGFTVDEKGETHGITVGLDTNPSSGSAGRMQYITSKWGVVTAPRDTAKGTQENYAGTQSSRFETIGAPKGTYNGVYYSDWLFMEDRFASPSLATAIHKDDSDVEHTYVFLAYYDDLNNDIRFRYGDLNETTSHTIGRTFGGFVDQSVYGYTGSADGDHKSFNTNTRLQDFSVIAASGISGNYLSIDIIKGSSVDDDVIVATWYDSTNDRWYYAYKKKPCTDNDLGSGTGDGYWSTPKLLASNAGEDCHISVDPRGGVHIAAYDGSEANLLYAYYANYNDPNPQIVTVDSYAFTGEHLTIDTAFSTDGNYVVPLIGYYMGSAKKPKIARLDKVISASDGSGTIPAGVDETDVVTGKWETAIIPTESKYSENYSYSHVNVGVWKDATGKIKKSNRPADGTTNVDTWTGSNKAVGDETKGYFWGNGTNNPVLGYAIRVGTRGYIETAQMK